MNINVMEYMDKKVKVGIETRTGVFSFEGKVFDVNVENKVLWVEVVENGELVDTYDIHLTSSKYTVGIIEEEVAVRDKDIHMTVKEAKKDFMHKIRHEEEVEVKVKICNTIDSYNQEDVYDIEINAYVDGEYLEGTTVETFYDEESSIKRAKAILTSVKGWFKYSDEVIVDTKVEIYYV